MQCRGFLCCAQPGEIYIGQVANRLPLLRNQEHSTPYSDPNKPFPTCSAHSLLYWQIVMKGPPIGGASNCPTACQERDQPDHEEDKEQNLRDADCGTGKSAEAE